MPSYSIVFLDVDGTLLDSAHRVSPATRTLLRKLHDRGVPVVLASARPPKGLEPIYDQLGVPGPGHLLCRGAGGAARPAHPVRPRHIRISIPGLSRRCWTAGPAWP